MLVPANVDRLQRLLEDAAAQIEAGQHLLAITPLREVIKVMPGLPEPHFYLGQVLNQSEKMSDAAAEYRLAIDYAAQQGREYFDARLALGDVLMRSGTGREEALATFAEAARRLKAAIRQDSRTIKPRLDLGRTFMALCRFEEALAAFRAVLKLDPGNKEVDGYIAQTLIHLGRYTEAVEFCGARLAANPSAPTMHATRGLALLAMGRWRKGFDEYRWRWGMQSFMSPRLASSQPVWNGEDPRGRTIIVYWEQGNGDVIQFSRFCVLLARRGAKVVIYAKEALARIVGMVEGISACLTPPSELPAHDYVIPLMDMARQFIEDDGTIPAETPYLFAPPDDIARWRDRLKHLAGKRVGIVWAGNHAHLTDLLRSTDLAGFSLLADLPGVDLVSLQQGPRADDPGVEMFRPGPLADFADTAALIQNLDLVIAVDTAVAHLAGALGKPVWVLLPHVAEWRWGVKGDTTPWYPSMKLFRQKKPGDWAGVMRAVRRELEAIS